MDLHRLVPLVAFALNVTLGAMTLARSRTRLNRVFVYLVSGMAVWNLGVFFLRRSAHAADAILWEVFIHVGVVAVPALFYHFVLIFLDATPDHRPSLTLAYAATLVFTVLNLTGSALFIRGVIATEWGWAPAPGPLYWVFFGYFNVVLLRGVGLLIRAHGTLESSFRRNRTKLILLGASVSIVGACVDIIRSVFARWFPALADFYPVGIPANMIFALMLGTSIVRYRLFDVSMAVKKGVVYSVTAVVISAALFGITHALDQYLPHIDLQDIRVIVPLAGFLVVALLSPLGRKVEDAMHAVMFSKRRGCYRTLLELTKRMGGILSVGKLVDTLLEELVRGVPLGHAVLLTRDDDGQAFVPLRAESALEKQVTACTLFVDSPIVNWLERTGRILVIEEALLDPDIADHLDGAEGELEAIDAALIVPLKVEGKLTGILFVGEKLSGDIFVSEELEVLSVVANQAAVSLENARLYDELGTTNARLLQASRLKSSFLASMSHELRTPLNAIIGFSKVLTKRLAGDLNEQQDTYVRSVHGSATHLLQLINTVLDISRIEAGKLELTREPLDLAALVHECVESSAALARDKPLTLGVEIEAALPPVTADATKVRQILLNLLSNAVKFTAQGHIVVRAELRAADDGDRAICVSVADSGIGMREQDLTRIFEPFNRLDNPLAQQADGSGLGLTISKKFVELHGGRIWAESREKYGSTFYFTLPTGQPVDREECSHAA